MVCHGETVGETKRNAENKQYNCIKRNVHHGYNEIKKAIETDASIKATIDVLKKKIDPN